MLFDPPISKGELEFYEALLKQTEAPCFTRCRRTECGRTARTSSAHPNLRRMPRLSSGNLEPHSEARHRRPVLRNPYVRSVSPTSRPIAESAGNCLQLEPARSVSRSTAEL